jgi:hypothetical protein
MKPPDVKRSGSAAAQPGRESGQPDGRTGDKPRTDPREVQGIGTARHADQRSPAWPEPKGWRELSILWEQWPAPGAKR